MTQELERLRMWVVDNEAVGWLDALLLIDAAIRQRDTLIQGSNVLHAQLGALQRQRDHYAELLKANPYGGYLPKQEAQPGAVPIPNFWTGEIEWHVPTAIEATAPMTRKGVDDDI